MNSTTDNESKSNIQFQKWIVVLSVVLFAIKITAWFLTSSVAILSDALESIVNIVAGCLGLYSLWLSARPRDQNHPYGHGKVEFISAGVEGSMVALAGAVIAAEAIDHFIHPGALHSLNTGLWLIAFSGIINFLFGYFGFKKGQRNYSPALLASGKHLMSDSYTTAGILIGLFLVKFTGLQWIDGAVALIFGILIIVMGYRILRKALGGIMDESDEETLEAIVKVLNDERRENWVDLHKTRLIRYGPILHIDCHLTVPWYLTVQKAHSEIEILEKVVNEYFPNTVEVYAHMDGCTPIGCPICPKSECPERQADFKRKITWSLSNVALDQRHGLHTLEERDPSLNASY